MSSHHKTFFLCKSFSLQGAGKSQLLYGKVNWVGGWWSHCDSQQNSTLTCQNEQMYCYAKRTNCLSLKIVVSLSKSALITFLAPVCEYCSLFFLQTHFFLNNTLVIEKSKHHLSDPWLLLAKLYGLSWWYYSTFEDTHTGKKSENGKLWKDANNSLCSP